jgi:hypothetical protein
VVSSQVRTLELPARAAVSGWRVQAIPGRKRPKKLIHTKEPLEFLSVSVVGKNNHHLDVVPKRGHSGGGDAVADEVKFGRGERSWRWRCMLLFFLI